MLGQGLVPEQYHPIVDMMSRRSLKASSKGSKVSVGNMVAQLPEHQQFINHYCSIPTSAVPQSRSA